MRFVKNMREERKDRTFMGLVKDVRSSSRGRVRKTEPKL